MKDVDDIISLKHIMQWFLIIVAYFIFGYITRGYFNYFTLIAFAFFYIRKKYEYLVYLTILWLYIYEYFNGIRMLSEKPEVINVTLFFSVFLILIFKNNFQELKGDKFLTYTLVNHLLLLAILIISIILNNVSPLKIGRFVLYFLLFLVILLSRFDFSVYKNIIDLIFAIGVFQIPIAFAQYLQYLPAPSIRNQDISFADVDIQLLLDDVACGTFGPASSPDLSLFLSFLAFILFIHYFRTKNTYFLIAGFFLLLQYTIVDSKTVLGVSILILFLIIVLNKWIRETLAFVLNFKMLLLVFGIGAAFYFSIISYYSRGYDHSGQSRLGSINEMLTFTKKAASSYLPQWGKIKGFKHVAEIQKINGVPMNNYFGLGIGEVWYRPIVKQKTYYRFFLRGYANHFLDTSSTLISLFAEIGIIGLVMFMVIYFTVYRQYHFETEKVSFTKSLRSIVRPMILGFLIYAFINKELKITDISIQTFWIFLAINYKLSHIADSETVDTENSLATG